MAPISHVQSSMGVFLFVIALWILVKTVIKKRVSRPPGPRGLPLLGNLFDLPPPGKPEWQHWAKHKDLYGPITSVNALGQTIVVVHDIDLAFELLNKRSVKCSSRPLMPFASMCGYGTNISFSPYNKSVQQQRKLIVGKMGSNVLGKLYASIELQTRRFLMLTLNDPDNVIPNLEFGVTSLILDLLFGYSPDPNNPDPLVSLAKQGMDDFSKAVTAGAWLVDFIPWLEYLPEGLPGTGFKKIARQFGKTYLDMLNTPVKFTEQQMACGNKKSSFISDLFVERPSAEDKHIIKLCALGLYGGAAHTIPTTLAWFFVAMTLFPEVQKKAQVEIDSVLECGKLPSFEHRASLPYIEAVVKETLRWMPIAPLGLPRASTEDIQFCGHTISKGSIILANVGWISQDPKSYHSPQLFKPERFLGENEELNPYKYGFGFGRRICPGLQLSEVILFLMIAQSLAAFNIKKPVDPKTGNEFDPAVTYTAGAVAHPIGFQCRIALRNEKYREVVKSVEVDHPWEAGDAEFLRKLRNQT